MTSEPTPHGALSYGDEGDGPPVVLLHAFPLARAMWRPQVEDLRGDYRIITPDLPGFGTSHGFAGTPSVEAMADAVADLLDQIPIAERVVLGGLSMGGYVALAFARRYGDRLRGLILADTRSEPDNEEGRANRDKMIALASTGPPGAVIEQMMPRLLGPQTAEHRPEVAAEVRRIAADQHSAGIVAALRALRDRPDAGPWLGSIGVPTLVLVGRDDALTPPALAEPLAKGIPGARLVVLEGAGHLSNLERPEAFNAAVREFLVSLK
jgi:3-oxoadipate enol-lactonase